MIDIGGRSLHVQVTGAENRQKGTVILEAGIAATSMSWALVQPLLASFAQVISYDRAGFGWSDTSPHASTAANAARDLGLLVSRLDLPSPIVFVGHSFGGLIVRVLQEQNPEVVSGMVLVDPVVRAEWRDPARLPTLSRGVRLSRRGAWLARLGVVGFAIRQALKGSTRISGLFAKASAGRAASITSRLAGEIGKMPRELWPAIAAHWSEARSFRTMADYLENLPLSAAELDEKRSLEEVPIIILSAANSQPLALREHDADARLSSRGEHVIVPESGHWILLDQPQVVAEAVGKVLSTTMPA